MLMRAMIFAAGLGSRLQPITNRKPKALVEVNGKPLLLRAVQYLESYGVSEIVVNAHHFSKQIIDYCQSHLKESNIRISDEVDELLDTGGGLKKAGDLFMQSDEPIIVLNADIITNLNLNEMLKVHQKNVNFATLAVRNRNSSRKLVFNENNELVGWRNLKTGEIKEVQALNETDADYAFSGIHIISPKAFKLFPTDNVFSIIDFYLSIAASYKVGAYQHDSDYWFDVGSIEKLKKVEGFLEKEM